MRPMLATRGDHVPSGPGWSHEVKWDGMRILADLSPTRAPRLWSRNENDVSVAWPELADLPRRDLLLDGELVVLADGRPSFEALASRMHVRDPRRAARLAGSASATFLVFDVLRADGRDLLGEPLAVRREVLAGLGLADVHWQVPAAHDDGDLLLEATRQQGLEGIVSKRLSSHYEPGRRSPHWLKFPHRPRDSWVVGGWRPETGSSHRLGALLVGEHVAGRFVFRGRVGSGIAGRTGPQLLDLLTPLETDHAPFSEAVPRVDAVGARWVRPEVVVDVESLGVNASGRLRQPSFRGVRSDLSAADLAGSEGAAG